MIEMKKRLTYEQLSDAFVSYLENQIEDLNDERDKIANEIEEIWKVLERFKERSRG